MKNELRPAIVLVGLFALVTGLLFPLAITGIASVTFPSQAHGSLLADSRGVGGSSLIGQDFTKPEHFHPRPSAAGNGYDAAASSGSNLGPTNAKLLDALKERAVAYRKENGLAPGTMLPPDSVTTSASGLDPHISPENARLQVNRVASARGKSPAEIQRQVDSFTEGRTLGFLGEPRVNVVSLNRALDGLK